MINRHGLANAANVAHYVLTIDVLACLSATCPVPGGRYETPTTLRLFATAPDLRADFIDIYGGQNGYWYC